MAIEFIVPTWPAPGNVKAVQTTRSGGASKGAYAGLNLGAHVGDIATIVAENRRALLAHIPAEPAWLNQVHGVDVVNAANASPGISADAVYAHGRAQVCAVLTADCLPVLFCSDDGAVVAAAHAGWRGLANGVLEHTVAAMQTPGKRLLAWLGPAIGPSVFEVGEDVRERFMAGDAQAARAFSALGQGKYLADIYELARMRLAAVDVGRVYGGDMCTSADPVRFYSYRRDQITGRQASLVWID